ncbi:hypothetical protein [Gemmatimonas sp.]|uniref:hypothetical protein n=1 Tax=Gemmatimonas sp. TaxID=1962908 RepID=UPI003983AA53
MVAASDGMTAEQLIGDEIPGKRVELVRGQLGWATVRGRLATADPGFTLARRPDTVRAPDVAYLSRERYAGPMPDGFREL